MDPKRLLEMLTSNPAGGAAMGGLAGSLLGNVLGRKGGGKKLLKYGGLAAIGYVAYQAWQSRQGARAGTQPSAEPRPAAAESGLSAAGRTAPPALALPAAFDLESGANASNALRVIQAMVAASKADGVVDGEERDRVFAKLREANLPQADQDEVLRLLTQPMDMEAVVRGVIGAELSLELYAASVFAVWPASRAERAYLDLLSARLGLDEALVAQVEQAVAAMEREPR